MIFSNQRDPTICHLVLHNKIYVTTALCTQQGIQIEHAFYVIQISNDNLDMNKSLGRQIA